MKNSLDCKKLLSYGKELSIFAGILLVLLFVFSCNNILMRNSGSLVITVPGARAASASTFTIELASASGFTQSETISGGSTIQFDDLAPDTYTINVKGMDDAGNKVLSGTAKATVTAGETESVTVDLESSLGNLTVSFEGAESDSVAKYTVILSGPNESKETQVVESRSVSFEGLIPGDYIVSVEGKNGDVVVLTGTPSKVTVEAGKPKSVIVKLQKLLGSLTVNFSGASATTGTTLTVTLTDSNDVSFEKTSSGEAVQFDDLAPGAYNIVVEGMDASGAVVLYGTRSATVEAGATASAPVNLVEGVSDFAGLEVAVAAGGIVNVFESIDVEKTLSISNTVTIIPTYQDVTLKNTTVSGNLFTVADSSGNLTIGGGEYTITLDGNQVAQSIISVSNGNATLRDNGIITNAAASGIKISYGTFEMTGGEISKNKSSAYNGGGGITISGGIFNMTGGRIIDNTGSQSSGGVTVSSARFNMTGGTITDNTGSFGGAVSLVSGTFDMSGGSITGNTVESSGGGVSVSGGEFKLSGGSITGNSAKNDGDGVYMSTNGAFNMSGSAVVDSNNDVYLSSSKVITVAGTLSGTTPVATITPASYAASTQVVYAADGVNLAAEVGKFVVTPNGSEEWTIGDDGTLRRDKGL